MKIDFIPKYQQGGTYMPPYAVYQPLATSMGSTSATTSSKAAASTDKSSGSSKDLTDKDILTLMKDLDGLPSDMAVLTKSLQNFYIDQQIGPKTGTASIASRYLSVINQLKTANFNRKEYDAAYEAVSKNGGINEIAINERGQFVCYNKEKKDYALLTAEELKKSDGYQALTNSELLYLRAQSPEMANNNTVLSVVKNGIGIEAVTKMISEAISNLGSSENSQEGYVSTQKGRLLQGLQDFQKAVQEAAGNVNYNGTVDDLYKYKYLTKDQSAQAKKALTYIYSVLPENAKALLKSKSDLTETGAIGLIQTLIASKIDSSVQFTVDMEGGASTKTSKEANANKDNTDLEGTQNVSILKSVGGVRQLMTIDRGDGIQMSLFGTKYNLIKSAKDNQPIQDTSMANMLAESGIQGIIKNTGSITFGDQKISFDKLKNVTYNNTGIMRANLPINPDGTVNLSLLDAYSQAEKKIEALGQNATPEQKGQILKESGLADLLKSDGTPDESKFGAFIVTEGYTTDSLTGVKPSDFVKEYTGDTDKAAELIKQCLTVGEGKDAKSPELDMFNWINPADWFGNYDHIYKAAIYIPITNNTSAGAMSDNQSLDYDEVMAQEQKYQNFDKMTRARQTGADVLNN